MKFFKKMNQARQHSGFTFRYDYREYELHRSNPYSYSQFMEHRHRRFTRVKDSMKLPYEAGMKFLLILPERNFK